MRNNETISNRFRSYERQMKDERTTGSDYEDGFNYGYCAALKWVIEDEE